MEITNLKKLLPEEKEELRNLFLNWQKARSEKDYKKADELRAEFEEWDNMLGTDGLWYPIFESREHCKKRAFSRMEKYKVDIHPWKYEDVIENKIN